MLDRRTLLAALAAFALAPSLGFAFEVQPYDAAKADAAIKAGKAVVLHVYADWCLQCHAQKSIFETLKTTGTYDNIAFFRVGYDDQRDIVTNLKCSRATVIAYKGGKEVKRMSWGMSTESVEEVLKAAE